MMAISIQLTEVRTGRDIQHRPAAGVSTTPVPINSRSNINTTTATAILFNPRRNRAMRRTGPLISRADYSIKA